MRVQVTSIQQYLSKISALRKRWKISKDEELWFRAEDRRHLRTRLQPSIFRPTASGAKRLSVRSIIELDCELYGEFRRCAPQLSESAAQSIENLWDSYFLMQHHGVPTRLLDWTDGALIALHFAVRSKSTKPRDGSLVYARSDPLLVD